MVEQVWLHIGTPKSGTSSLQKYMLDQRDTLAAAGLAYLTPPGKSSANDLAIAINRDRPTLDELAGGLNEAISTRPERIALISSEMLYGIAPARLFALMPALTDRPLHVLVYLTRQDRYIQAKYVQRLKNARFSGTISEFIAKFDGSGSDYAAELASWENAPGQVRLVPRVLEPARLTGGDVVSDALDRIGLSPPVAAEAERVNVSPGLHRAQLLQAANAAGLGPPRRLQRQLSKQFPQDPSERAQIFSRAEKRAYLSQYADGNEALRARYFPDQPTLFDASDLEVEDVETGIPPFTPEQLEEITRLLKVVRGLA